MAYFDVTFKFVNGDEKRFVKYQREDYLQVATEVMRDVDGWFGTAGDLVNLSNVLTCEIVEVDEEGYPLKE